MNSALSLVKFILMHEKLTLNRRSVISVAPPIDCIHFFKVWLIASILETGV